MAATSSDHEAGPTITLTITLSRRTGLLVRGTWTPSDAVPAVDLDSSNARLALNVVKGLPSHPVDEQQAVDSFMRQLDVKIAEARAPNGEGTQIPVNTKSLTDAPEDTAPGERSTSRPLAGLPMAESPPAAFDTGVTSNGLTREVPASLESSATYTGQSDQWYTIQVTTPYVKWTPFTAHKGSWWLGSVEYFNICHSTTLEDLANLIADRTGCRTDDQALTSGKRILWGAGTSIPVTTTLSSLGITGLEEPVNLYIRRPLDAKRPAFNSESPIEYAEKTTALSDSLPTLASNEVVQETAVARSPTRSNDGLIQVPVAPEKQGHTVQFQCMPEDTTEKNSAEYHVLVRVLLKHQRSLIMAVSKLTTVTELLAMVAETAGVIFGDTLLCFEDLILTLPDEEKSSVSLHSLGITEEAMPEGGYVLLIPRLTEQDQEDTQVPQEKYEISTIEAIMDELELENQTHDSSPRIRSL